jgi:hypothetical protein
LARWQAAAATDAKAAHLTAPAKTVPASSVTPVSSITGCAISVKLNMVVAEKWAEEPRKGVVDEH